MEVRVILPGLGGGMASNAAFQWPTCQAKVPCIPASGSGAEILRDISCQYRQPVLVFSIHVYCHWNKHKEDD